MLKIGGDFIYILSKPDLIMSQSTHFCPICGFKNTVGAKFCEGCGGSLQSSPDGEEFQSTTTVEMASNTPSEAPSNVIYAEFGDRLVAFFIDGLVFQVITSFFGLIFGRNWVFGLGTSWTDSVPSIFFGFLYFFLFEAYNHGQTLGKMAMKLRTVDDQTFQEPTPSQAALHSIGQNIALFFDLVIMGVLYFRKIELYLKLFAKLVIQLFTQGNGTRTKNRFIVAFRREQKSGV